MKKTYLLVLLCIFSFSIYAQSVNDSVDKKLFLFEEFIEGAVRMKSGTVEHASLNYNTDNQNIVFIKDGQYMVIADLEAVDTIYLQQKKFVPLDKAIYQVVSEARPVALLVSYTHRIKPYVATTDKNGTSKQIANQISNTVSDVYVNRIFKGNYMVEILKHYWFAKNGKTYKANSKRRFLNSLPSSQRKAIENYITENSLNFTIESDLIRFVNFCNSEIK